MMVTSDFTNHSAWFLLTFFNKVISIHKPKCVINIQKYVETVSFFPRYMEICPVDIFLHWCFIWVTFWFSFSFYAFQKYVYKVFGTEESEEVSY